MNKSVAFLSFKCHLLTVLVDTNVKPLSTSSVTGQQD